MLSIWVIFGFPIRITTFVFVRAIFFICSVRAFVMFIFSIWSVRPFVMVIFSVWTARAFVMAIFSIWSTRALFTSVFVISLWIFLTRTIFFRKKCHFAFLFS
uniref:Uncharacterized protein n=1 Tax=Cacopsylla melanoneura TaxID=428564 RepID=A0A8D8RFK9_9HEMI